MKKLIIVSAILILLWAFMTTLIVDEIELKGLKGIFEEVWEGSEDKLNDN